MDSRDTPKSLLDALACIWWSMSGLEMPILSMDSRREVSVAEEVRTLALCFTEEECGASVEDDLG